MSQICQSWHNTASSKVKRPSVCSTEDILNVHSAVSGLQILPTKTAFIVKGVVPSDAAEVMADMGFPTKPSLKYLRVFMGHVISQQAFVGPVAESFRRANVASYFNLSTKERVIFLKPLILTVILVTARAYITDLVTISSLVNAENFLFGFNSWGSHFICLRCLVSKTDTPTNLTHGARWPSTSCPHIQHIHFSPSSCALCQ